MLYIFESLTRNSLNDQIYLLKDNIEEDLVNNLKITFIVRCFKYNTTIYKACKFTRMCLIFGTEMSLKLKFS